MALSLSEKQKRRLGQRHVALRMGRIARHRMHVQLGQPFMGYVPDLPDSIAEFAAGASDVSGLVAMPLRDSRGKGEVLRPDDGWVRLDPGRLPLGGWGGGTYGSSRGTTPGGTGRAIVALGQFRFTDSSGGNELIYPFALTASIGSNAGEEVRLYVAPNATWEHVPLRDTAGDAATPARGSRDYLWDWTEAPFGAPGSTQRGSNPIPTPCVVFCNGQDNAYVFPDSSGTNGWDELDRWSTWGGAGTGFSAKSCTTHGGRILFLDTKEGGIRRSNRVRWTAVGTCDPDPSILGAGYLDLDFDRGGMRILAIGDGVAVYMDDGVAILRRQGLVTNPYRPQIVSRTRGLISPKAVTDIGPNRHFGVFNDGWFILDSSGRWTEAGTIDRGGTRFRRWKDTFYARLDINNRQRLTVSYDPFRNFVRISVPRSGRVENDEIWIYDINGDRVWLDKGVEVTEWGWMNPQLTAAVNWGPGGSNPIDQNLTWSQVTGTWRDYEERRGLNTVVQGDSAGYVFFRDYTKVTREDRAGMASLPNYSYRTKELTIPSGRDSIIRLDKVWLGYVNVGGGSINIAAESDEGSQSDARALTEGSEGTTHTTFGSFHLAGQRHQVTLSGQAPVAIRDLSADLQVVGIEDQKDA